MTVSWRRTEGTKAELVAAMIQKKDPPLQRPVGPAKLRNVKPDDVAARLRGLLGLPPEGPASEEAAAFQPEAAPSFIQDLDASAWIAWCLLGLPLFAGDFPSSRAVCRQARRFLLALALARSRGNRTDAAKLLQVSRKSALNNLHRFGLDVMRRRLDSGDARGSNP